MRSASGNSYVEAETDLGGCPIVEQDRSQTFDQFAGRAPHGWGQGCIKSIVVGLYADHGYIATQLRDQILSDDI